MSLFHALGQNNLITYFTLFLNQDFKKAQMILIIYEFHIGEFTYLLKCICGLKINTCGILVVIYRHAQRGGQFELPAEVEEGDALPSWFHLYTVNKCPLSHLLSAIFFVFCGWLCCLTRPHAQCWVLSVLTKCQAVMCLMEKIRVRWAFVQAD